MVGVDNLFDNRQPQPRTWGAGGAEASDAEKSLEDFPQILCGNADAGIGDAEMHTGFVGASGHGNCTMFRCEFDGVAE